MKLLKELIDLLEAAKPIPDHPYHSKKDEELHYIIKDAGEAARNMKGHDDKAEAKYTDQVNDASTILHYRKKNKSIKNESLDNDLPNNKKTLPDWLIKQYEERAEAERAAGGQVEIDNRLPTISIITSAGDDYFFQGHEAENLLDEVPDDLSPEDYFLAVSQSW